MKRLISTLLLALACAGSAHAVPITMHFTAAGLTQLLPGLPVAPTDPVTGTIVWDADTTTSGINSLLSIILAIDGHAYSLSEVGFSGVSNRVIGGTLTGVNGLQRLANDFSIVWTTSTLSPDFFSYTSAATDGLWLTTQFTGFSITDGNAVPIPGTLALFAAGAFGFAARRRRS